MLGRFLHPIAPPPKAPAKAKSMKGAAWRSPPLFSPRVTERFMTYASEPPCLFLPSSQRWLHLNRKF